MRDGPTDRLQIAGCNKQCDGRDDEQRNVGDGNESELSDRDKPGKGKGKIASTVRDTVCQEREALKNTNKNVRSINQRVPPAKPTSSQRVNKSEANKNAGERIEGPEAWGRAKKRGDNKANKANKAVTSSTKRKTPEKGNSDWSSPER